MSTKLYDELDLKNRQGFISPFILNSLRLP